MSAFYTTLANWWPVISPVEEYAAEADDLRRILAAHHPSAATLLELGSGGGHVAFYLRRHYDCVLTDLSAEMLAVSQRINPECEHRQADMRALDLGRRFDVVLAHDAIDYMTTEADLEAVAATAWRHLHAGGLVVLLPDAVAETYAPGTDVSGSEHPDGRAARLFEWNEPLAPGATQVAVHYAFLLRAADGTMQSVYERHETGVFPSRTWERALAAQGFEVSVEHERTTDEREPRLAFIGRKPVD
ncbi:MAG: class I SAM-dependent methyltransferase [Gemmatimonadaceae bacterium]|nr:class I SAM-dependent methyltransferase [Gemmatimonadaceae bacterium]